MKRFGDVVWAVIAGTAVTMSCSAKEDTSLTTTETKWLEAADPVLAFAVAQGLPIDVVVRPRSEAGDVPFSVGVQDHRCKLILSMRNRADAELTLADVPASLHATLIEAMTAHEVAHCWRYIHGVWNTMPAGFVEPLSSNDNASLAGKKQQMRSTRREEAYADLVALAWTQQQHPAKYAEVYAWLLRLRQDQPVAGSYHDSRIWLDLAQDAKVFPTSATPFEQVQALWLKGLLAIADRE